ncbi:MAG TPA: FGGY-family carbohydrate kinase [Spirochaetia bacterium]|nr:FGGY-family carbohydrate kinase [Spirochaetia bacterium]
MSLLGIDVGTTGCKAIVFSESGEILSSAYSEYDISTPHPQEAVLDTPVVWERIKETIRAAASRSRSAISALSVTSMGEAVVPVSADRRILGPSILNVDIRGQEFVPALIDAMDPAEFYRLTGNVPGNQYGLPKLMWLKRHQPELYRRTACFLNWSSFVTFMLGGPPVVDYSLADRSLLFDMSRGEWSDRLLSLGGIDRSKLPEAVQAGTPVGNVSPAVADELGLSAGAQIVVGTHDQCASAVGAGAVRSETAMYGMGTFPCIMPVFSSLRDPAAMMSMGLNTEHHAAAGLFGSFIYHMGGATVKWFRNQLAGGRSVSSENEQQELYETLFREMPHGPSGLLVLPHFAPMGPPDYIADSSGVVVGLTTETPRGALLRAIVEGNAFALRVTVDRLPAAGIAISELRAVGGGSKSLESLKLTADIFNLPVLRPHVEEAGALGAALLAGVGIGTYQSVREAADVVVTVGEAIEPDPRNVERYTEVFGMYQELRATMIPFTRRLNTLGGTP